MRQSLASLTTRLRFPPRHATLPPVTDAAPHPPLPAHTLCPRCGYEIGVRDAARCPECGLDKHPLLQILQHRRECEALIRRDVSTNVLAALFCIGAYSISLSIQDAPFEIILLLAIFYGFAWLTTVGLGMMAARGSVKQERACWRSLWLRSQPIIMSLWLLIAINGARPPASVAIETILTGAELLIALVAYGAAWRIRARGRRRYGLQSRVAVISMLFLHTAIMLVFAIHFYASCGWGLPW